MHVCICACGNACTVAIFDMRMVVRMYVCTHVLLCCYVFRFESVYCVYYVVVILLCLCMMCCMYDGVPYYMCVFACMDCIVMRWCGLLLHVWGSILCACMFI